jgi:HSP20 family protein
MQNYLTPWSWLNEEDDRKTTSSLSNIDPFSRIRHEMNQVFNDFFKDCTAHSLTSIDQNKQMMVPLVNIAESDTKYKISAEMPGINEKDIDLTIADGKIIIKAEKKNEIEDKKDQYYKAERSYGMYQRIFSLPEYVDADKIQAKFENGVLNIEIPKIKNSPPTIKKIAITK